MIRRVPQPLMRNPAPVAAAVRPVISDSVTPDLLGLHPQVPDMFIFYPPDRHTLVRHSFIPDSCVADMFISQLFVGCLRSLSGLKSVCPAGSPLQPSHNDSHTKHDFQCLSWPVLQSFYYRSFRRSNRAARTSSI
jgi:hypothetical protein